jgi:dCTP diphosphatase
MARHVTAGLDQRLASSSRFAEDSLEAIAAKLRVFRDDRDWQRFHTPRNLAISLAVECGELLEHFQWVGDADLAEHLTERKDQVAEELADVAIYAIQLADSLELSLSEAIATKIECNAGRYPVELASGNAAKHTELHARRVA